MRRWITAGRRWFVVAWVLVLIGIPFGPVALAQVPVTIEITDALDKPGVSVEPGTTITWINRDDERHRIRSTAGPAEFDSGNLDPGASYSITLVAMGSYRYLDDRNDDNTSYHGTITVSNDPQPEPPPDPGTPPAATSGDVDIVDRQYRPGSISVAAGSTVTWTNSDDRAHTVTERSRAFDSGIFDTGGSWSRTFNNPGTFEYFCTLHPDMVGSVVVTGDGGEGPSDPVPPPVDPVPAPSDPAPPGDVSIIDNAFSPGSLTVTEGTTLVWSNAGALPHTVTSTGVFDSGILMPGDTYSHTFSDPGTFAYLCSLHPEMKGVVAVTGADGVAPPAPSPGGGTSPLPGPVLPSPPAAPPPGDVSIIDNAFTPSSINVSAGTTVVWSNTGSLPHTVTATGAFDSGILMSGSTFRRTFSTAGTFSYICSLHPEMKGTITVTGAGVPVGDAVAAEGTLDSGTADRDVLTGPSDVRMFDNGYKPGAITVIAGSSVSWTNDGDLPHTATARDGSFDSGFVMSGDTFTTTFTSPGSFEYFCSIHPEMAATVRVLASGGEVPSGVDGELIETPVGMAQAEPTFGVSPDDGPNEAYVAVIDNDYRPRTLRITQGTTVRWENTGEVPHTVTAQGVFDSGILVSGQQFEQTFVDVGTVDYLCTLHPGMEGRIIVEPPRAPDVAAAGIDVGSSSPMGAAIVLAGALLAASIALATGMAAFGRSAATGEGKAN